MANRHPLILDSDGIIRELSQSDVFDLDGNPLVGSNRIDTKLLRVVNDSEVVFALPQNKGYFGQTLVTDSLGNVEWQSLNTVQYTDSELLFAFNNSISQLNHNYLAADSDAVSFVVGEFVAADLNLQNQINTEVSTRISNVSSLLSLIQTETVNRRNADSDLDLISKSQITNTFYVNNGGNTFANAITKVGTSTARQIILPPGSSGSTLNTTTLTNANMLNITGPAAPSAAPAVEVLGKVVVTGTASTRVRFSHVQFDGEFELNGTQGRHSFKGVVFQKAMRITGSTTNFIIFEDCSFDGGFIVPNTFAGVIFLLSCSFNNIAPTLNQFSAQQVIFTQCTNLPSFPANATVAGQNALTSGFVRNQINELFIGSKRVNANLDSDWVVRQVNTAATTFDSQTFTFTNNSVFTLSHNAVGKVAVFRNGVRVSTNHYSVSQNVVTYNGVDDRALVSSDEIVIDYLRIA